MQEQFESSEKRQFEPVKMEIVTFDTEDVITTSQGDTGHAPMSANYP